WWIDDCPDPIPACSRNPYRVQSREASLIPCPGESPIIVDVNGDGVRLTGVSSGVYFDLNNDNTTEHLAWTNMTADDAFLSLDRNENGTIDNGNELFGNYSPQPTSEDPNGFLSLAEFDLHENGGNGDGVIDDSDGVFSSLRLWRDGNHNGVSDVGELHTLPSLGVGGISLSYEESTEVDLFGNRFRYSAVVFDESHTRRDGMAWDVWLLVEE
ncbi:MAG: hypothetical protein ACREA9_00600, partial [Pyrinomonadaceae bacterium]